MTACIVGWAHTAVRPPRGRDGRKPDRAGRGRGAGRCRHRRRRCRRDRARPFQRGLLGAGFHRLAGAAGRRPICASSARAGSRMPAPPARPPCIRASSRSRPRSARIVLVVGAEQMTTTPAAEIGRNLLKASYVREEADIDGGFAGIFGKIAGALFPALGRPVRRARAHRRQEPQERRRQSRTRRSARTSATISAAPRARRIRASPARSSAPTARWSPTAPPRSCWPTSRPRSSSARPLRRHRCHRGFAGLLQAARSRDGEAAQRDRLIRLRLGLPAS